MTNRKLVQGLIGAYAGFVVGVTLLGSSVNLLGSTLNFFTDPISTQRLAEFDDDGASTPDLINGPRILEIFRSAADVFAPLFGHPTMVPNMIRLDDAFEMPGTSTHPAAPVMHISEPTGAFDEVAPRFAPEDIRVSNEFQGGNAAPGIYLVPIASPSSSLPAFLTMPPPPAMPSTSSSSAGGVMTSSSASSAGAPMSTPPAVTAPPSSTPPVMSAPPVVVPPTASSDSSLPGSENCTNGTDDDGDGFTDCEDTGCDAASECAASASSMGMMGEVCDNSSDDDSDGMIDCDDDGCMASPSCMADSTSSF